jgi:hypothetical protein
VLIAKPVIEEITLPVDFLLSRQIPLPIRHGGLESRISWKGDDGVQMIGHQQQKPAVPDTAFVVERRRRKNGITGTRARQVVHSAGLAIDGNEMEAAFINPLRDVVRETISTGKFHA